MIEETVRLIDLYRGLYGGNGSTKVAYSSNSEVLTKALQGLRSQEKEEVSPKEAPKPQQKKEKAKVLRQDTPSPEVFAQV